MGVHVGVDARLQFRCHARQSNAAVFLSKVLRIAFYGV